MTFKEIQELIKLINRSNLTEFKLKDKEFELTIKTNKQDKTKTVVQQIPSVAAASPVMPMPAVQQPVAPAAPAPAPAASKAAPAAPAAEKVEDESKYLAIKSPIVGTFYRSSSPEKGPYVKVGDKVEVNQVVCIVEAMKLFNEIESEISGTIVKVMVEDAQPVEYDQVLFLVDPS
ncbi:MAG: acetyl-CoA carboxylase biotin carboxyl carrier protein [Saprospiraceae bacterium]|jgi:acetyl-CoA carboxylase biotin carboxyl carrier protein|nr:acetyl-CoA carboxylase biotin carboxyl carrier protein [Saprospiraceae bacterium]